MESQKNPANPVHPRTAVLTRGFDPKLSVGSARPAVFRSSTYVFSTPEAAERAFDVATGRSQPQAGENVELIYSRISHPNAEILEDQVVPLELGARSAAVFNSGMAAIMTAFLTFLRPGDSIVYTIPVYGGTGHLIQEFLGSLGITSIPVAVTAKLSVSVPMVVPTRVCSLLGKWSTPPVTLKSIYGTTWVLTQLCSEGVLTRA